MALPSEFLCFFISFLLIINPIFTLQHYDNTRCTSNIEFPGSNYLCRSTKSSCDAFIVYRAQEKYRTLTSISSLFNTTIPHLLSYNSISQTDPDNLKPGREIIVPVTCSCLERFSEAVYYYNASNSDSLPAIACEVFEGLVKAQSLIEENPGFGKEDQDFSLVEVPVKCACPDESDVQNGMNYLVTYPVVRNDSIHLIALRFGVSDKMIMDANGVDHLSTIFPQTTLLIPMKEAPILNLDLVPSSEQPDSDSQPNDITQGSRSDYFNIILGVMIPLLIIVIVGCGSFVIWKKRFMEFSTEIQHSSPLSPDLLDGMSKLKNMLIYFSFEDIRAATKDFAGACLIGSSYYRGKIGDSEVAVEEANSSESAKSVVSILNKINHINVVKLVGFCLEPKPYLVYEFVKNGGLRECLSNSKTAKELTWKRRVQIGVDVAVGLHYIHYCTRPNYIHQNINSKTILITEGHRAKISGFKLAKSVSLIGEKRTFFPMAKIGYIAPEFLNFGSVSTKVDVYAFGMVLLELLSGREVVADGILFKDFMKFWELQNSSGCLETVKMFLDPVLENDFCLEEAMCLAVLARGCVEEDPMRRPSINDVLKALFSIL